MNNLNIVCSVMEENKDYSENIRQIFLEFGDVAEFKPVADILPKEGETPPDLILLEASLFNWDWLVLVVKLKRDYSKIPVILFSIMASVENGFTSLSDDESIYLANDLDTLREGIRQRLIRDILPKKTVLFVDDDENILNAYVRMLRKSAWHVIKVSSGEHALDIIQAGEIDIVVTDIKMPNMHGFELISEIRKRNKEIPIVVSSGYPGMRGDDELGFHNIAAFIEKPVEDEVLLKTLTEVLI